MGSVTPLMPCTRIDVSPCPWPVLSAPTHAARVFLGLLLLALMATGGCGEASQPECSLDEQSPAELCATGGLTCGSTSFPDGCGGTVLVDCGSCDPALVCSDRGQCINPGCSAEGDRELCDSLPNPCGIRAFVDRCDQNRRQTAARARQTKRAAVRGNASTPPASPSRSRSSASNRARPAGRSWRRMCAVKTAGFAAEQSA